MPDIKERDFSNNGYEQCTDCGGVLAPHEGRQDDAGKWHCDTPCTEGAAAVTAQETI